MNKFIVSVFALTASVGMHAAELTQQQEKQHALNQRLFDAVENRDTKPEQVTALLKEGANIKAEDRSQTFHADPVSLAIWRANFHLLPALTQNYPVQGWPRESWYDTYHAGLVVKLLYAHPSLCDNSISSKLVLTKKLSKEEFDAQAFGCTNFNCPQVYGERHHGSPKAFREASLKAVEFLLSKKADVNCSASSVCNIPMLVFAGQKKDLELCRILLKHGANPRKRQFTCVGQKEEVLFWDESNFEDLAKDNEALQKLRDEYKKEEQKKSVTE